MRFGFVGIIAVAFLALEIVGIALVAGEIGGLATLLWLLGAALAGGWLIRGAGAGFMTELVQATSHGRDPFSVMWKAGRRFLAGLLLIFPGPLTDVLGLMLLLTTGLPPRPARPAAYPPGPGPQPQDGHAYTGRGQRPEGRRHGEVIEGEFRRED
jgi:UPF0716 protein FxsA